MIAPIIPVMIMCSHSFIPIMRGMVSKNYYFDGEPMTTVVCYALGIATPFEEEKYNVEVMGDEAGKCKPGHGITSIALYIEEDKTLQKFQLTCQKLKSDYLDSDETWEVKSDEVSLDCTRESVMSGLEAKKDGDRYIVTANCQKLKYPNMGGPQGPPGFGKKTIFY